MDPLTSKSRADILTALTQRHKDLLRSGERFKLVTEETVRGVRGRLALFGGEDGTRVEIEARVEFPKDRRMNSDDALGLVLDALDLSFGEYLEAGRTERLNAAFEERELEGNIVFLRGRVRRPDLESAADKLLGESAEDEWA